MANGPLRTLLMNSALESEKVIVIISCMRPSSLSSPEHSNTARRAIRCYMARRHGKPLQLSPTLMAKSCFDCVFHHAVLSTILLGVTVPNKRVTGSASVGDEAVFLPIFRFSSCWWKSWLVINR